MITRALERKEMQVVQDREAKELHLKRWDIFKEKRERFIEYYIGLKN